MSDSLARQAPFWRAYHDALRSCNLPDAHGGVSGSALVAVWRCFADHANNIDATAYPSIDRVALQTRLSSPTVQRAIKALVSSGWLKLISLQAGRRPPVYQIIILGHHGDNPNDNPNISGYHGDRSNDMANDNSNDDPNPRVITESSRVIIDVPQGYHGDTQTIVTKKELVVDAHEGDDAPTTTQQDEEGEEEVAPPDDLCPDGLTQWMLDAFEQYGFPLGIASATSLMVQLRGYGLTLRQIQAYITERLIDAEMHDKTPRASYLIGDAPAWLKARQPHQPHPEDVERERKRREEQEYLWESERQAREEAARRTPEEQAAKEIYYKQLAHQFWGSSDEVN